MALNTTDCCERLRRVYIGSVAVVASTGSANFPFQLTFDLFDNLPAVRGMLVRLYLNRRWGCC
jgi:hypothetical protein